MDYPKVLKALAWHYNKPTKEVTHIFKIKTKLNSNYRSVFNKFCFLPRELSQN